MSTVAYRASLVREINQAMKQIHMSQFVEDGNVDYQDGKLDAYAHILTLISDMEGE